MLSISEFFKISLSSIGNMHESLHLFSSCCRNSLKAACQKFHEMLKIMSCSFLLSQESRYLKKKKKKTFLPLGSSAPDLAIFFHTNFLSLYFTSTFSQSSSREQIHNTIASQQLTLSSSSGAKLYHSKSG